MYLTIGQYSADLLVLLDTGASHTLLDGTHVRAAGLDLFSGAPVAFQGFLGARPVAYMHPARLQVGSLELESRLAFSSQPLHRQVLGRDLMAHLLVGLKERDQQIFLGPVGT